jgi:hypothetical protein
VTSLLTDALGARDDFSREHHVEVAAGKIGAAHLTNCGPTQTLFIWAGG